MRIKVFNTPELNFYSWVELGVGLAVSGGFIVSYCPF